MSINLLFFKNLLRKSYSTIATQACSYLSLSISHFNLAHLDLCKFTFDEPLQSWLVINYFTQNLCELSNFGDFLVRRPPGGFGPINLPSSLSVSLSVVSVRQIFSETAPEFSDFLFWKKKIGKKVTFPKNSKMAPFWSILTKIDPNLSKMTKTGGFSHFFFLKTVHWNFLIFCTKPSLWSRKKFRFRFFGKNSKMTHFGQNLPKFGHPSGIAGNPGKTWK